LVFDEISGKVSFLQKDNKLTVLVNLLPIKTTRTTFFVKAKPKNPGEENKGNFFGMRECKKWAFINRRKTSVQRK
jgi:hypothetical protein